ncbi:Cuticle-degrading protease [Purpureocillium lavendulum]|uniref:alpha-1,3-glucan synthase n=1 Tax=Purpureocillium lavendulum TaxID=1247861 RepID=A0AB34FPA6_9HYPO|nr:Cuticle-degrading protease [Purpureocillium lavendulum]
MAQTTRGEMLSSNLSSAPSTSFSVPESSPDFDPLEPDVDGTGDTSPSIDYAGYEGIDWNRLAGFSIRKHRKRARTGWVWEHGFDIENTDSGHRYWLCKLCHRKKTTITHMYDAASTSQANSHMEEVHHVCKGGPMLPQRKKQRTLLNMVDLDTHQPKDQALMNAFISSFDPLRFQHLLIRWVSCDNIPFHKLESPYFRDLMAYANSAIVDSGSVPTHSTIRDWIVRSFNRHKGVVTELLRRSLSRINVSFDAWSSRKFMSLLGLTVHFLDDEGNFRTFLLGLPRIEGRHCGENLADRVSEILHEYGLEDRVGYFVTDNAESNDTCLEDLGRELGFKKQHRRLRCCGHIINLVARSILFGTDADAFEEDCQADKEIQDEVKLWRSKGPIGKLHNTVHWVERSGQRIERLHKLQSIENTALGLEDKTTYDVVMDNATRWNSSEAMMERAYTLRNALDSLVQAEVTEWSQYVARRTQNGAKPMPKKCRKKPTIVDDRMAAEDWSVIAEYLAILKPLKIATKRLEGRPREGKFGAIWEVLLTMEWLLKHLEEAKLQHERDEEPYLRIGCNLGWMKLDQYYALTEDSPAYLASLVLHPAFRWSTVESQWSDHPDWLTRGRTAVQELWEEYRSLPIEQDTIPEQPTVSRMTTDLDDFMASIRKLGAQPAPSVCSVRDEYAEWVASTDPGDCLVDDPIQYWLLRRRQASGLRFDPRFVDYNLNQNRLATNPLDFSASRPGFEYHASPENWRFPFYTIFIDRFANGDPTNDNANNTVFEQDLSSNQLRHGGDLQGLVDSLDYIAGCGMKGIYIAGSPFINVPWGADSYSPLDLTLLDHHFGDIKMWQKTVDEIHRRGMYVILDHTMSTMGDLIAFKGFENSTAKFKATEYNVKYKTSRQYHDFQFRNNYKSHCAYPKFWDEAGKPLNPRALGLDGCFDSDFDQYGDIEASGVFPDWQRSLSKSASVQDRLREWVPSVRQRLEVFSCLVITMLDIDGFRFDKATQVTVDALGAHSAAVRECAGKLGKNNFFLPGEITGGNAFGSIYLGRGRDPAQAEKIPDLISAMTLDSKSEREDDIRDVTIRDRGQGALDAAAFHYSVYRYLTRFLGMSGNIEAGFDLPSSWTEMWHEMVMTNDMVNANTGQFDPRHMLGATNQDVFRWPAIHQGTERLLMGLFISTMHFPSIPLVMYGEEQAFYLLDSTAENYIFGRQPITSSQAWKLHGCHTRSSTQYHDWPLDAARRGCHDDSVASDHRDPTHPIRNIMKAMYAIRENFPVLGEGWLVEQLSNQTTHTMLAGSKTATEFGIWSVVRSKEPEVQAGSSEEPVWLVYHNRDTKTSYEFDCSRRETAFMSPFDSGSRVRNLFYPYDTVTLGTSSQSLDFGTAGLPSGCLETITMNPYEFRLYVPEDAWTGPPPMLTKFTPGHDSAINSAHLGGQLKITLEFSEEMDCGMLNEAISVQSTVEDGGSAELDAATAECEVLNDESIVGYAGAVSSNFRFSATLKNVQDGVHTITIRDAPSSTSGRSTNSTDHLYLRIGSSDNPVVFPASANYSKTLLSKEGDDIFVHHAAAGADQWRYSTNWGSTYSEWRRYHGGKEKIRKLPWSGTSLQGWDGDHVIVQYFSKALASSSFKQEGDSNNRSARRFPHLFAHGSFNKFGFDTGISNQFTLRSDGRWEMHLMDEWPTQFQLNVWGMNPDGKPDAGWVYGDVDMDGVVDRMPPGSLAPNVLNASVPPPMPALSYRLVFDDATFRFTMQPTGKIWIQIVIFVLLATLPLLGGLLSVWVFMGSFYKIKINKIGFRKRGRSPFRKFKNIRDISVEAFREKESPDALATPGKRRKVIIATMEYNIDDWNIKIKIGGLGVMAQLMGKALEHQDLIWVVPCVGDVDYPVDRRAEPINVPIMGKDYEIEVQYHQVQNITYVLLDAPIFRQQTKADPYPARMDDIDSAIYYSAWNECIAEAIRRFNPDLYHINDYHGAVAPLHLLPHRTIPCALSLHNAEFQGLWPMRTPDESKEVCNVFNLDPEIVREYVQFGSVFNLLHAAASYLRLHQKGFGAVGVSKKYGERSYARYPIFWGLSKIGQLPNPDPSDTAEWSRDSQVNESEVVVDAEAESHRGELRKKAQEWAGLKVNPDAELFVFVGRWSLQKGVDLIADIFPSVLEKYPTTQLICVGPVIDLYGKLAALKLAKLMEKYPGRVYSKPEFTALPPYIFSGAEFALIPSRDEPFGLVAVEFGRKGALGVGARVGGLGQMPGFWYTVESVAPQHLLRQFREAIASALGTKLNTRQTMRAWSAKQRFPVKQWVEDLDTLQSTAIKMHNKEASKRRRSTPGALLGVPTTGDFAAPGEGNQAALAYAEPRSRRASAASLNVPRIIEPTDDHGGFTGHPSVLPYAIELPASAPTTPPAASGVEEPFLQRTTDNDQSARSSVTSVASIRPIDSDPSRRSVDTLAMRMMSPDGSETQPHPFGLHFTTAPRGRTQMYQQHNSSRLSLVDVVGGRDDLNLQKVEPFFTDSTGEYSKAFEQKLATLTAKNSDSQLCIEEFLKQSEKEWFSRFRDAKLGRSRSPSRTRSPRCSRDAGLQADIRHHRAASLGSTPSIGPSDEDDDDLTYGLEDVDRDDEFLLGAGYKPPKGLKRILSLRFGDWPVYSFILVAAQVLAANPYQIVLLVGETSQTAAQFYIVTGVYGTSSLLWWIVFRRFKALYTLSLPWFFYGLAFFFMGVSPFMAAKAQGQIQTTATALYAVGASSGGFVFAMNFGDEGKYLTHYISFRASSKSTS